MNLLGVVSAGGAAPGAPTIGTATAGDLSATVTYTAPTWTGKGSGAVIYTATSSPGGFTGTGTSPITVSGLTNGTAYTFTVKATTSYGVTGPSSAASNSITPAASGDFYAIATATCSGGDTNVTFSSISATYKHLQIRAMGRNSSNRSVQVWLNGDSTGSSYPTQHFTGGYATTSYGGVTINQNPYGLTTTQSSTDAANTFAGTIWECYDFANTSKYKTMVGRGGYANVTGSGGSEHSYKTSYWNNTAAVTSIVLTPYAGSFSADTTFALYGIK